MNEGKYFSYCLISRRSRHRAGARYHSRGVDMDGNVSNYVETEQIIWTSTGQVSSFVQVRGSIPVLWKQVVKVQYKPNLVISGGDSTLEAFTKHFDDQISIYGDQIVVNLINQHGYEKPLSIAFAKLVEWKKDGRIRYIHFDFHQECSRMRWDRISVLIDAISGDLDSQGYFLKNGAGFGNQGSLVQRRQSSVVRTNCIDCLDRTNVVQSVIAKQKLVQQLQELGIITNNVSFPFLDHMFQNVWADNADAISMQYSGTGALKTDYTRTGKRSKSGIVSDLMKSILRYVKNHYLDGFKQDAFDLFTGEYVVSKSNGEMFASDAISIDIIIVNHI